MRPLRPWNPGPAPSLLSCVQINGIYNFISGSDGRLRLFGSSYTRAGLKDSGIDICFENVRFYWNFNAPIRSPNILFFKFSHIHCCFLLCLGVSAQKPFHLFVIASIFRSEINVGIMAFPFLIYFITFILLVLGRVCFPFWNLQMSTTANTLLVLILPTLYWVEPFHVIFGRTLSNSHRQIPSGGYHHKNGWVIKILGAQPLQRCIKVPVVDISKKSALSLITCDDDMS